jgi:hypothetical protein
MVDSRNAHSVSDSGRGQITRTSSAAHHALAARETPLFLKAPRYRQHSFCSVAVGSVSAISLHVVAPIEKGSARTRAVAVSALQSARTS